MAAEDREFMLYVMADVLGHIEGLTSRAMFGGYGIYRDGIIFAIITYGELYFKVGETNRADYEALESRPFVYEQKGHGQTVMSYWIVPDEILEDREAVELWVDKAVAVSKASKKGKKKSKRKKT